MDWRFKTGIMKRKLNEKASDTDKEKVQRQDGSAALGIILSRSCIQTAFFFSRCLVVNYCGRVGGMRIVVFIGCGV